MFDITSISAFLISIAVIAITISAVNYIIVSQSNRKEQIKANKLRETELLWALYKRWSEPDFLEAYNLISSLEWNDYDDYMAKYGPSADPELEVKRGIVGIYFESMGILLKRGLVDVSAIDDMMSGYIIGYWKKYMPIMHEFRKRNNRPEAAEHIEYLYNTVEKVYREQHPKI